MYLKKNKTALVTGGASGIGLAFADNLAKQGYNVFLVDIQENKMKNAAERLRFNYNIDVHCLPLDLSKIDAAETVYDFCKKNCIEIYILISNAGQLIFDAITEIENNKYNSFLQLQVNTPAKLCKLFGSSMKTRREGYILIVSSLLAWMPYPYISIYSSVKSFLRTFSKSIRFEFSNYNVGITTVCPGAVDTDLYDLKPKQRKLAKRWGVMISPDLLAKRSLKRMFRKKITYIPGIINKIILPLIFVFPVRVLAFFYNRIIFKQTF